MIRDKEFDFTRHMVEETLAGRVIHLYLHDNHYELMDLDFIKLKN